MNERLPLHILPTFVIAAQLENLRATAQRVSLTHGAVSQQIQQLEQAIGYPLFDRSGRGVRLNAAGRELLAATEPALLALQQGVDRARRVAVSQMLRISVLPSFAHYWLLPRLAEFHRACPGIGWILTPRWRFRISAAKDSMPRSALVMANGQAFRLSVSPQE